MALTPLVTTVRGKTQTKLRAENPELFFSFLSPSIPPTLQFYVPTYYYVST